MMKHIPGSHQCGPSSVLHIAARTKAPLPWQDTFITTNGQDLNIKGKEFIHTNAKHQRHPVLPSTLNPASHNFGMVPCHLDIRSPGYSDTLFLINLPEAGTSNNKQTRLLALQIKYKETTAVQAPWGCKGFSARSQAWLHAECRSSHCTKPLQWLKCPHPPGV